MSNLFPRNTKDKEQYSRVEDIDPSLAKLLLDANQKNRRISDVLVTAMARDMIEGRWRLSHQGIALDKTGRLLDGQHRLSAIIKANVTIRMVVTYNVEPDAFEVIDLGGRARSIADMFALSHNLKYSTTFVAALRILRAYGNDDVDKVRRATPGEITEAFNVYGAEVGWAVSTIGAAPVSIPWKQAPFVAAVAYAYPTAKEEVQAFLDVLTSETAAKTVTMAALRRAMERERLVDAKDRLRLSYLSLRAIDYHLRGIEAGKLYQQEDPKRARDAYLKSYLAFRAERKRLGFSE